jgi:hypothetical protein
MTPTDTAVPDGARADSLAAAPFRSIFNSATGEQIEFTDVREDIVRLNWRSKPGGSITEHVHPRQQERFLITAGQAHFTLNGERRVVGSGETLDVPAGAPLPRGTQDRSRSSALGHPDLRPGAEKAAVSTIPPDIPEGAPQQHDVLLERDVVRHRGEGVMRRRSGPKHAAAVRRWQAP